MDRSAFIRNLHALAPLDSACLAALHAVPIRSIFVAPKRDILAEGSSPNFLYVMLEGWGARYALRWNGTRRITGILLPGEFCGLHCASEAVLDHSIVAIVPCQIGMIDRGDMRDLLADHPGITIALWRAKLRDETILRKWLLFSDKAITAVAHFLCETYERASFGQGSQKQVYCPLMQVQIGDALGLTAIHTNRVLKSLREAGLVSLRDQTLTIMDEDRLRRLARFDPSYLRSWQKA